MSAGQTVEKTTILESEVSVTCDQKFQHQNEKKTCSTKSEKWRQVRTSVEIAWTNEQKEDLKWFWRHRVVTKFSMRKKNPREGQQKPQLLLCSY